MAIVQKSTRVLARSRRIALTLYIFLMLANRSPIALNLSSQTTHALMDSFVRAGDPQINLAEEYRTEEAVESRTEQLDAF
jgi:hypothetical protein